MWWMPAFRQPAWFIMEASFQFKLDFEEHYCGAEALTYLWRTIPRLKALRPLACEPLFKLTYHEAADWLVTGVNYKQASNQSIRPLCNESPSWFFASTLFR